MIEVGLKHRGEKKIKVIMPQNESKVLLRKPEWIRVKWSGGDTKFAQVKNILRTNKLHTVCEEASCPNMGECFSKGTATFMILGDICTRRCPFCDVGFGRPKPVDIEEPIKLAQAVAKLDLNFVVITSVDRDDLKDGGAEHFVNCIKAIRESSPNTKIEVLVPDFRGRAELAIDILSKNPPDVFNHNLENVPRLYKQVRPGADYLHSLKLLQDFKTACPQVPTKSGLMVGLGEEDFEINQVMKDMRAYNVEMITIGQYLQPSPAHYPVQRFVPLESFEIWKNLAQELGFVNAAIAPMVRSSYHADEQAKTK